MFFGGFNIENQEAISEQAQGAQGNWKGLTSLLLHGQDEAREFDWMEHMTAMLPNSSQLSLECKD